MKSRPHVGTTCGLLLATNMSMRFAVGLKTNLPSQNVTRMLVTGTRAFHAGS